MDYFDLSNGLFMPEMKGHAAGKSVDTRFMVISFTSDWLYPSYQSQEIVRLLKKRRIAATYCDLQSSYGHDAFLVDIEEQTRLVKNFLSNIKR